MPNFKGEVGGHSLPLKDSVDAGAVVEALFQSGSKKRKGSPKASPRQTPKKSPKSSKKK